MKISGKDRDIIENAWREMIMNTIKPHIKAIRDACPDEKEYREAIEVYREVILGEYGKYGLDALANIEKTGC